MRLAGIACATLISLDAAAQVRISQVYAGGGNTGATYTHDYVELFNAGAAQVTISNWSLQYGTATGTTWNVHVLTSGTIAPRGYYLLKLSSGGAVGSPLPVAEDATVSRDMAAGGAKVALRDRTGALSSGCNALVDDGLLDLVGWGSANCSEGNKAGAMSNTSALVRQFGGCKDTDDNGLDLALATTFVPRNRAASCNGSCAPSDTTCDGKDDDCDGQTDEQFASGPTTCGAGACVANGTTSCANGQQQTDCTPLTPPTTTDPDCDGVDDDCDTQTDEEFAPTTTNCGSGACATTGVGTCAGGQVVSSCSPLPAPTNTDPTCDNFDDDCDAQTDEDYPQNVSCFLPGACEAGNVAGGCSGGQVVACQAGTPLGSVDETCDGVDDDCNGEDDEEYAPHATSCGAGACTRAGVSACADGEEQNVCTPGDPAADDATCDGVDDDCDTQTDEEYAPGATSCGVGACAAAGVSSCVGGEVQPNCTPGNPAAGDANCDGVDDDCSGAADEDYLPVTTVCGTGACAATGATSCVAGQVQYNCTPGEPGGAGDADCDDVDDDCDGSTDEEYVPLQTSCGEGACGSTGSTYCRDGEVRDTCTPRPDGTACPDDDLCNGNETCQGGKCLPAPGTQPVVCAATDECHLAGVCVPATGLCTNPMVSNGQPCSNGECQDGQCVLAEGGCGGGGGCGPGSPGWGALLVALVTRPRRRR